jgi:hypothetical protein
MHSPLPKKRCILFPVVATADHRAFEKLPARNGYRIYSCVGERELANVVWQSGTKLSKGHEAPWVCGS